MNKLEYKNNWCSDEYYVNGEKLSSLRQVKIKNRRYKVESHNVSVPYNDMGHVYNAVSFHHFIKAEVFGIEISFDLNEIVNKVDVEVIDWSANK